MPFKSVAVRGAFPTPTRLLYRASTMVALACALTTTLSIAGQQHAHTHGRLTLGVAVDAQTISLGIESPLEAFLGFERAPRTETERKLVSDMTARLNAADQLFQIDPAAGCKLSRVELNAPVLGFGPQKQESHDHGKDHSHEADEHADIDMDVTFTCAQAGQARYIDVKLFDTFKRIRAIDAQVASPQGQFKRPLSPGKARLSLVR